MPSPTGRSPALPRVVALTALLTLVMLAPARARGGCVHDELQFGLDPATSAHFQRLIAAGAMADPADLAAPPIERERPGGPRPCSGPSCSGQGGLPTAPAASIAPAPASWAWSGPAMDLARPGAIAYPLPGSRPRPVGRGPSIFHPPRCPVA